MTTTTLTLPDWLAAAATPEERLALILAAVSRCFSECSHGRRLVRAEARSGPHMTTGMAEIFIAQDMEAIAAAERDRLRTLLDERFKVVLAQPDNGYLVDAVPWASLLEVLAVTP